MWTCPDCGRTFRNTSQQHTCHLVSKEDFFAKRPPGLRTLFAQILDYVRQLGEFREEAVLPDVIFFKTKSTFLAVKVKKEHLIVEFFLDHPEAAPPVKRYLQTSRNRVAHEVPVDSSEDLDEQLFAWIRTSFELIQNA